MSTPYISEALASKPGKPSDKANFIVPDGLTASSDAREMGPDGMRLMTMRSDDQLSTTISLDDRFRGIYATRAELLVTVLDIERLGLVDGFLVPALPSRLAFFARSRACA